MTWSHHLFHHNRVGWRKRRWYLMSNYTVTTLPLTTNETVCVCVYKSPKEKKKYNNTAPPLDSDFFFSSECVSLDDDLEKDVGQQLEHTDTLGTCFQSSDEAFWGVHAFVNLVTTCDRAAPPTVFTLCLSAVINAVWYLSSFARQWVSEVFIWQKTTITRPCLRSLRRCSCFTSDLHGVWGHWARRYFCST